MVKPWNRCSTKPLWKWFYRNRWNPANRWSSPCTSIPISTKAIFAVVWRCIIHGDSPTSMVCIGTRALRCTMLKKDGTPTNTSTKNCTAITDSSMWNSPSPRTILWKPPGPCRINKRCSPPICAKNSISKTSPINLGTKNHLWLFRMTVHNAKPGIL